MEPASPPAHSSATPKDRSSALEPSADSEDPSKLANPIIEQAERTRASFNAPAMWMIVFGHISTVCAGIVNVVAYRGLGEMFVSHISGTTAHVGMKLEGITTGSNSEWDLLHQIFVVASFVFGSFVCGLLIPHSEVHFGGRSFYGVALLGNSCLLTVAAFVAHPRVVLAGCLTAMACGLQNAMCTMHFGAIIRTTHVTGTATDIGSSAGRAVMILLRRPWTAPHRRILDDAELEVNSKKLQVLLPLFVGFLIGCALGALFHNGLGMHALLVPAAVAAIAGFLHTFFRASLKKELRRIEERRLKADVTRVEASLARARSFLHNDEVDLGEEVDLGDMDGQLAHALEVMHDLEATITELCDSRSNSSNGQSPGRSRARDDAQGGLGLTSS